MQQLFAMSLRALNLGSKFVVFFLLAKYADPKQLSLFGIYWTSIVTVSALMGFELYGHTIRTFISEKEINKRREIVGRHIGSLFLMSFLLLPFVLLAIYFSLELLAPLVLILGLHLMSELISQDNSRLLIGLERPLQAILLNTMRGAVWAGVAVAYILTVQGHVNIYIMIYIWAGFSLLSLFLSFILIGNCLEYIPKPKVDLQWLFSAIKVSSVLILCALSFRALISGDKYLAESLFGADSAAYYIFYATIAFAVSGLIESGVSAWYYPRLVSAIKSEARAEFLLVRRGFFIRNIISSIALSLLVVLVSYISAKYYLDELYLRNFSILLMCMFGVAVYSCSMPDHYSIYGLEKDKAILLINFSAAVLFFSSAIILKGTFGIHGIALAFASGLLFTAISRRIAASYYLKSFLLGGKLAH